MAGDSAIADLREIVERICQFVAARGVWPPEDGTPEKLLIEAAGLMSGVAKGMEAAGIDLSVRSKPR